MRNLTYAAADAGADFPQTPMRLKLGIWAGGDPTNGQGTIEWAGGESDYADCPYTMYVESVTITNYNPASAYSYEGTSGAFTSIESVNDTDGAAANATSSSTAGSLLSSRTSASQSSASAAASASASASSGSADGTTSSSSAASAIGTALGSAGPSVRSNSAERLRTGGRGFDGVGFSALSFVMGVTMTMMIM